MFEMKKAIPTALLGLVLSGCVDITIPEFDTLFPTESTFVARGTASVVEDEGLCILWAGENGLSYHLFQHPRLDNELFDRVTTPGTTSRLLLTSRPDLNFGCQLGEIVEVKDVFEILD